MYRLLILIFSAFMPGALYGQNIGFEAGSFAGWSAATGQCCPIYSPNSGFNAAQHAITSGAATDPYSSGMISTVAPGSLFSARLGNSTGNAESEKLSFSFSVPQQDLLLVIRYAVILENANHPAVKQPRFECKITDQYSQEIPCGDILVIAGEPGNNFTTIGTYDILTWQKKVLDLRNYRGQAIEIEFATGDCEPGGHFGYAYVDCDLEDAIVTGQPCNPNGSITLAAPPGFSYLWFDNSTAQSVTIAQPVAGVSYSVTLEPGSGCETSLTSVFTDSIPHASFTHDGNCGLEISFTDQTVAMTGCTYSWDFGDGSSSSLQHPVHLFPAQGIYQTSLEVIAPNNCRSTFSNSIMAGENVNASFSYEGECVQSPVVFTNYSSASSGADLITEWFIDGLLVSSNLNATYQFTQPGQHSAMLTVSTQNGCRDSVPEEIIILPEELCEPQIFIPNAFTPNGDGKNDVFYIEAEIPVLIYNRWGQLVFSGNEKWDGTNNGQKCPEGVYMVTFNSIRQMLLLIR